jgi:hypothetical protein
MLAPERYTELLHRHSEIASDLGDQFRMEHSTTVIGHRGANALRVSIDPVAALCLTNSKPKRTSRPMISSAPTRGSRSLNRHVYRSKSYAITPRHLLPGRESVFDMQTNRIADVPERFFFV